MKRGESEKQHFPIIQKFKKELKLDRFQKKKLYCTGKCLTELIFDQFIDFAAYCESLVQVLLLMSSV